MDRQGRSPGLSGSRPLMHHLWVPEPDEQSTYYVQGGTFCDPLVGTAKPASTTVPRLHRGTEAQRGDVTDTLHARLSCLSRDPH